MWRGLRLSVLAILGCLVFWTVWQQWQPAVGQVPGRGPAVAGQRALAAGEVDPQTSHVYVHVGKSGLGHEHAVIGAVKEGAIRLGVNQNAGVIVLDMASFVADTAEARQYIGLAGTSSESTQQQVTANMVGPDVLDVAAHPTATFRIQSAVPLQSRSSASHPMYRLSGSFTLHGVTRAISVDAEAIDQPNSVLLRGAFSILQTQFGITPYSKAFGTIGVADKLTIYGDIHVVKVAPPPSRLPTRGR